MRKLPSSLVLGTIVLVAGCGEDHLGPMPPPSASIATLYTGAQVSFAPPVNLPLNRPTIDVAVGDFNGDAIPDIAASFNISDFPFVSPFAASRFALFLGTGGGNFGSPTVFDPGTGCGAGQALEVVDVNNDGAQDVVMTHHLSTGLCFGNKVTVHLGDGAGGFATPIQFTTGGTPRAVAAGDFNEDGNLDLAIGTSDNGSIFIHLGNGSGSFVFSTSIFVGAFEQGLRATDLNADGHLDLIVSAETQAQVKVLFGTGTGAFSAPVGFPLTNPIALATEDFNEDGLVDFAVTRGSLGELSIFLGTGGGLFSSPVSFSVIPPSPGGLGLGLEVADFNGDGHQDLAMGHYGAGNLAVYGNVAVLRGDGTGDFATPSFFSSSADLVQNISVADLNGDGLPDVVATSVNPPGVSILLNTSVVDVAIDIKPGSNPNSIKLSAKGTIPVAILSAADFDAPVEVDRASLTFGRTGDEPSLAFCTRSAEDVNADGLLDLVCHFRTEQTGFQIGDTEGILKGETLGGVPIEGRDAVRIVS